VVGKQGVRDITLKLIHYVTRRNEQEYYGVRARFVKILIKE
jgi:hypothetical protein